MIIQLKTYEVADLPSLLRLVLRFIYEQDKMSAADVRLMQFSMIKWKRHLDDEIEKYNARFKLDGKHRTPDHEFLQDYLQRLGWLLKKDQDGKFDRRKELFKMHRIDWRKFHRLPEAFMPEDFLRGQEVYREYAKKNPELEDMGQQSTQEVKKALNIIQSIQESL